MPCWNQLNGKQINRFCAPSYSTHQSVEISHSMTPIRPSTGRGNLKFKWAKESTVRRSMSIRSFHNSNDQRSMFHRTVYSLILWQRQSARLITIYLMADPLSIQMPFQHEFAHFKFRMIPFSRTNIFLATIGLIRFREWTFHVDGVNCDESDQWRV